MKLKPLKDVTIERIPGRVPSDPYWRIVARLDAVAGLKTSVPEVGPEEELDRIAEERVRRQIADYLYGEVHERLLEIRKHFMATAEGAKAIRIGGSSREEFEMESSARADQIAHATRALDQINELLDLLVGQEVEDCTPETTDV